MDLAQCIDMTFLLLKRTKKKSIELALSITDEQKTRWQATDGHRLAQVIQPVEEMNFGEVPEIILPRKALMEIRKVCELMGEIVDITFDERVAQFSGNRIHFKTRLIEGKFPNCDLIIPKTMSGNPPSIGKILFIPENCFRYQYRQTQASKIEPSVRSAKLKVRKPNSVKQVMSLRSIMMGAL